MGGMIKIKIARAGSVSLLPGVWLECDMNAFVVRTAKGIVPIAAGDWLVTLFGRRYVVPLSRMSGANG